MTQLDSTDNPPTVADICNGLRHAADDHPCCRRVLLAAAEMLEGGSWHAPGAIFNLCDDSSGLTNTVTDD